MCRDDRHFTGAQAPAAEQPAVPQAASYVGPEGILIDSEDLADVFL
jgi:hypothetical protein